MERIFTLALLILIPVLILAGCGSADSTLPAMSEATQLPPTEAVPTPTPEDRYQSWVTYTNTDYGFSFLYSPDWRLEEAGADSTLFQHSVLLWITPTSFLSIAFKRADQDMPITRTGVGSGEIITRGSVLFLGEEIPRDVLVAEGKDMSVLYNSARETTRGNLVFAISLDYAGHYTDEATLVEKTERLADWVVESIAVIE